ncbi:MAG: hypothetical protein KC713_06425 [Candidatus Omnitrophica bacterium]|nr:hypothetical protein [Candidatus Omnitrophota bacterium]
MSQHLNNSGFASFVEIVITSIIFIIASLGIFTSISAIQPQSIDSVHKLEAAYYGKRVIEELYNLVDARTWNDGSSYLTPDTVFSRTYVTADADIVVNWMLTDVSGLPLRHMDMNVYYTPK